MMWGGCEICDEWDVCEGRRYCSGCADVLYGWYLCSTDTGPYVVFPAE
jgi:hypothetical protein